jgi:hypothetical protein
VSAEGHTLQGVSFIIFSLDPARSRRLFQAKLDLQHDGQALHGAQNTGLTV